MPFYSDGPRVLYLRVEDRTTSSLTLSWVVDHHVQNHNSPRYELMYRKKVTMISDLVHTHTHKKEYNLGVRIIYNCSKPWKSLGNVLNNHTEHLSINIAMPWHCGTVAFSSECFFRNISFSLLPFHVFFLYHFKINV